MASQRNNSSLKQRLRWIIELMLSLEGAWVKGQKGTLDNSTGTSSSANIRPNPHKQRAHLAIFQYDFGKACLVPLEFAIAANCKKGPVF